MRCFIAIQLTDQIRQALRPLFVRLKETGADIKWVPPENVHLTLKFLGETDRTTIDLLTVGLGKKIASCRPFYITIAGTGCFPSAKRPRVIWVGIKESEAVRLIQQHVETVAAEFGFIPEDRAFSPHCTIGRVKSPKRLNEATRILDEYSGTVFGKAEIMDIHIIESDLQPSGAVYRDLAALQLSKEEAR